MGLRTNGRQHRLMADNTVIAVDRDFTIGKHLILGGHIKLKESKIKFMLKLQIGHILALLKSDLSRI